MIDATLLFSLQLSPKQQQTLNYNLSLSPFRSNECGNGLNYGLLFDQRRLLNDFDYSVSFKLADYNRCQARP